MRRAGLSLLVVLALSVVAVLQSPRRAAAEVTWCWDDPVVLINGTLVSINVGVYGDPLVVRSAVTLATIEIAVPAGVSTALVASSNLYFTERVVFVSRGQWQPGQPVPVDVTVTFQATQDLPAALKITYPTGSIGASGSTAKGPLKASFALP